MQVNLRRTYKDGLGDPVTSASGKLLTTQMVLIVAVTTEFQEDQQAPDVVQEKLTRFSLYQKLLMVTEEQETIYFTPEEAASLKPRIAKCFGMVVSAPIILELSAAT